MKRFYIKDNHGNVRVVDTWEVLTARGNLARVFHVLAQGRVPALWLVRYVKQSDFGSNYHLVDFRSGSVISPFSVRDAFENWDLRTIRRRWFEV